MTLARTRENLCNAAYTDINREKMQQGIMNGIKNQLFSAHAFIHLPWAAWDAPKAVQTDMGPLSLLQLFVGCGDRRLLAGAHAAGDGQLLQRPGRPQPQQGRRPVKGQSAAQRLDGAELGVKI